MITKAPLSKVQYGIYAECIGFEGEPRYNLPYLYVLDGSLDGDRLARAIETAVAAHPTLFTHIGQGDDGEPFQSIDDSETFTLAVEETDDIEELKQTLIVPFQLVGGRLFHIHLLHDKEHYYFFLDIHHIIGDGTTLKVMLADVEKAYAGETLAPEQLTMAEVAEAEMQLRQSEAFDEAKQWYAKEFDYGDLFTPITPDLEIKEHSEDSMVRVLTVDMSAVDRFCKDNGIFKSNFFTSAYSFLLAKYNGEQQSLFTTIYNGRSDKRFLHSVGMTVKTLPVYCKFTDDTTVLDFLRAGQDQMGGVRSHEAYAFTDVVNDLGLQSNTCFAWHGMMFADETLCGKPMKTIRLVNSTTENSLYLKAFILNGHYHIKAEYNSNEYSSDFIDQLLHSYEAVVKGFLTATLLRDISIVDEEQLVLLDGFNNTDDPYDDTQTLVSLFRRQAQARPDKLAVVFKDKRYTYRQVDDLSDRIAGYVASKGLGLEDVVAILIPRCEWMAIASLGVMKAGCAFQPLDPSYPKDRLNFMAKDTGARLLIADEELRPIMDEYEGEVLLTKDLASLPECDPKTLHDPLPTSLVTLIYTSGSTGVPKGGMSEHRHWVAFCHMHQHTMHVLDDCKVAAYASFGFDASPMELFATLTAGAELYIVPEELRLDLVALNDYLESNAITHTFMTTQVAYQFATSIENHCLHFLMTGGEKLSSLTPPMQYTLMNAYGPSETICYVTRYLVHDKRQNIPIGKACINTKLYIVDKYGHRLPAGASGELWVAGPQVSRGYLNRPEKTAEVYKDNPFCQDPKYDRVYCTGDIVRYLPDGNIQFVGRRDGQVKIRGFRVELKEVEAIIREFPGIKDATVQAYDEPSGGKYIAAFVVSDEPVDIEALNDFILEEKPPYMVPAVTMQIDKIPLNQNQKVDKRALPKPEKKAEAEEVINAPLNKLEEELHEMIAAIVGTKDFGITTVLGYVGLTSISAIKLAVQANKKYGVLLDAKRLAKTSSLQDIENVILTQWMEGGAAPAEQAAEPQHEESLSAAPLTFAQTGVYFECIKNPADITYNIPVMYRFDRKGMTVDRLVAALTAFVDAHPALNTHFEMTDEGVMQVPNEDRTAVVDQQEMTAAQLEEYKQAFVHPFRLSSGPLYRFAVVTTEDEICLFADFHHLVADGDSVNTLRIQLAQALNGRQIEREKYTFAQYAADEKRFEESEGFEANRQYFAQLLSDFESASEVPADLMGNPQDGMKQDVVVPFDLDAVAAFSRQLGVTPAAMMLAAIFYTVSRYTNNRSVYLSTISNGRSDIRTAETVGMFVNTLPLGITIDDVSVSEFVKASADVFAGVIEHEKYPFARIAADYGFQPQILFGYQIGVIDNIDMPALRDIELLNLDKAKFKLAVNIENRDGSPSVVMQYNDAIYSCGIMEEMAASIVAVAEHMMAEPQSKVRSISIVSAAQEEALGALRQVATGDAPFRLFHECIGHFAQAQPDHEALVAIDARYTYRQMDEATSRIANALRTRGVQERDRVALLLPRTSRLILSLFGVLKTGAAYIPCDPEYPADRIRLILEDSEARYIITTKDRMDSVPADKAIDVETLLSAPDAPAPATTIGGDDLAYLIYTSGSTGRPKGVMLRHEGICNYLYGHPANVFANGVLTDARRILSVTTISFDAALQDIGMAYYNGKTLVLATEEQANNPIDLARLINGEQVNMVSGTPSRWQAWLTSADFREAIAKVDICRAGGEKFSDQLLAQMRAATKARIFNCYGPTEITVASNNSELTHAIKVTVGKPQLNVKEYIVDADGNELPVGVVGELYIGGRGVARGYNNLDEMTKERFVEYKGERVYRSGDYAKWLPDGDVVILGRTDHQIKLRGLRIELGEIENVMLRVEGMKKVVIMIRKINGREHLCAYYTADREIAADALKAEISKSLTQYMVPTAYLQMNEMPMTPNGKTDVKALPEPQLAVSGEYVAPASDTERAFADIFAGILKMDKVGATDNFFELGGTSLAVMQIVVEAERRSLHVAYADVFTNPTPRQLAQFVTGETVVDTADDAAGYDYSTIDQLLQRNTLDSFRKGERRALGRVLLTGATGYLGIHILHELIESEAETIYCLVRGKSKEAAEKRLRTLLFYYFANSFKDLIGTRLHVVCGDVTDDLTTLCRESIEEPIDTVFNCAAIVKHFSEGTEIEDVNVGGARRCVELCVATGARLVHVSTASTRGLWVGEPKDDVFTEKRLYMGQDLGNKYIHSKFMAERLILESVARKGLDAKIMRVGNLAARSTDGEFQANFSTNSFMGRIRVFNMLGCCPYSMRSKRVEFSPINEVSRAIVLLATTPAECTVFHPYNIHGQFMGDVLQGLSSVGTAIRFVEQEEFEAAMDEAKNNPQKARQLASLLAYQGGAHGQKTTDVARDNEYTTQVLYRLGFAFSPTSWDYVEQMLATIGGFGFFENQD